MNRAMNPDRNSSLALNCGFTPRWAPLWPHPKQEALLSSPKRFVVLPCGRRSGKTEIGKRKLVQHLLYDFAVDPLPWPDCRYFAGAPTRDQAKRIYWNDLKALTPAHWVKKTYESDLCITTVWGFELWVLGMDKPARIEGSPWNGGLLDEYANMKAGAWQENIRPALSDRAGWCWLVGVPEGRNHYFLAWQRAVAGDDPDWAGFSWRSSDILPQGEIDAARRDLDERTFRQEYEAEFVEQAGVVYYAFSRQANVRPVPVPAPPRSDRSAPTPVNIGMDFNVGKMCAVLADARLRVFGEIVLRNSNTPEMAAAIRERFPAGDYAVTVWPDATGKNRDSTSSTTDHAILRGAGFEVMSRNSNPLVKDRVNVTNAALCNAAGEVGVHIDPSCRHLIEDLELVVWKNGDLDGSDVERTHCSDAFGYLVYGAKPMLDNSVRGVRY